MASRPKLSSAARSAFDKKQKKSKQMSEAEQKQKALSEGIAILNQHPLFGELSGLFVRSSAKELGKYTAAVTNASGQIFLNESLLLPPKQWSYVIAHCLLHLAFGHFDAERMPKKALCTLSQLAAQTGGEYLDTHQAADSSFAPLPPKLSEQQQALWNDACDIYITNFLADIRFGASIFPNLPDEIPADVHDEIEIYTHLREHPQLAARYHGQYGTAAIGQMDLSGLAKPLTYDTKHFPWMKNHYTEQFAWALAHSVSNALAQVNGSEAARRAVDETSLPQSAARYFIDTYPLLGGLAAAFEIREDWQLCQKMEIQVAAIDIDARTIYVNPACGLSYPCWQFVLAHEYLHAGLCHRARQKYRDPYLWNVACDFVINSWLKEMKIGMPPDGVLYDEKLEGMSAETIYDLLQQNLKAYCKADTFRGYGKGDILHDGMGRPGSKRIWNGSGKGMCPDTVDLDAFCRDALRQGLEYQLAKKTRGYLPAGLIEEIRALSMPPIPWDVELTCWLDQAIPPLEKRRSYAHPSRRQSVTPDIPRPRTVPAVPEDGRTFGVVLDTSGSMGSLSLSMALGSIASYAASRDVPLVRVVFCDASAYDAGYLAPEDIAGRVEVTGRGGTRLQPGIDYLNRAQDFPEKGPILIITDGLIEDRLSVSCEHAYLLPKGQRLPFRTKAPIFYM